MRTLRFFQHAGTTGIRPFGRPVLEAISTSLGNSMTFVFFISTFILLGAWAVAPFIKSVPVRDEQARADGTGVREAANTPPRAMSA